MAVMAALVAAAALSLYQGLANALRYSQDFQWDAAKALCKGLDPYELSMHPDKALEDPDLAGFYAMFTDRGLKQKMEANQFPSLLLLLFPMTLLRPQAAKVVWCILNLVFTAGSALLLKRTFFREVPKTVYAAAILLTIAGTPYRNQLGVGQHTLFAFFFFMAALWLDMKEDMKARVRVSLTALCLFVSFFKYTLTGPLALYFVYRKRYRELVAAALGHIVLTALAALYLDKSFVYMIKGPLEVASRLVAEGGIDLGVVIPSPYVYGAALAILITVLVIILRMGEGCGPYVFAMLVLWSLVIFYHRTYDFFVLSAVPAMFYAKGMKKAGYREGPFKVWYCILIALTYFGLRIFDENTASKIITAVVYYTFTTAVTYIAAKYGKEGRLQA